MSRIQSCFEQLKKTQRKALIPYVTAGDNSPQLTVPLMHAMVEAGANIIELGIPFSDPMADGPVIQQACERALSHGVTLSNVLAMVAEFRKRDNQTPVVLMGYLNPVEVMGYQAFAEAAADAGVDGVLTVDLPPEEAGPLADQLKAKDIDIIYLLAPTTAETRIKTICDSASGFIYYVSLKGVTGAATLDVDAVNRQLTRIRQYTQLPVGVGFGIRDAETAKAIAQTADAVVVGSAIVKKIATGTDDQATIAAVKDLLGSIRQAID
ncbi:tryptophan synthase subunit alpha [Endozoicomonas sp. SM1973]|uniref:Tryptophan synthase alpha chain n=1 Tax=Spartinivicinus marinus TaxID=2994442 RepID=A0A853IAC0_9GAMM|nr:tryptophan synthase subunit alpha [Spartinivicinus marinus]MCX4024857.1 tryptophan synthase subunit alpha [Spartinivicinus marinus]NYZ66497.1 tryptophan synthase subunit alpha [Spartinivicinus marinus]